MASNEPPIGSNEPQLSPEEVADLNGALSDFRNALTLPKGNPGRSAAAKRMRTVGFSVSEILALSGGSWKESTVKNYVASVKVASSAPAPKAIGFLTEALDENLTIETVLDSIQVQKTLETFKVRVKDIAELLNTLKVQNVPLNDFVNSYHSMANSGLTPANLKTALDYKKELEVRGLEYADLVDLGRGRITGRLPSFGKVTIVPDGMTSVAVNPTFGGQVPAVFAYVLENQQYLEFFEAVKQRIRTEPIDLRLKPEELITKYFVDQCTSHNLTLQRI